MPAVFSVSCAPAFALPHCQLHIPNLAGDWPEAVARRLAPQPGCLRQAHIYLVLNDWELLLRLGSMSSGTDAVHVSLYVNAVRSRTICE